MPKELIEGQYVYFENEDADPDVSVVAVRWSRETGEVAIATRLKEAEVPYESEHDPIPAKYGWHVNLDRKGTNDLIRVLRRARDQAFGKDE